METADRTVHRDGSLSTAIANMVVQVFREHTGRGPTRSRTHLSDELVAVVLQDTLTPAERKLAAHGKTDVLLATRRAIQDLMRSDLVAGVEQLTGQKVAAAFTDVAIEPDMTLASFVLAPASA